MVITEELVSYVANLSHIQLDDKQMPFMVEELTHILGLMEVLNTVNTEGIEPLSHVFPITNITRPDVVTDSLDRAALLANAPACTEEAFVVPKIVG